MFTRATPSPDGWGGSYRLSTESSTTRSGYFIGTPFLASLVRRDHHRPSVAPAEGYANGTIGSPSPASYRFFRSLDGKPDTGSDSKAEGGSGDTDPEVPGTDESSEDESGDGASDTNTTG